jgi:lactate racemase
VQLYCGGPIDRSLTGVTAIDSLEQAIVASARAMGDPHVAVIPEGPYVVPYFRAA